MMVRVVSETQNTLSSFQHQVGGHKKSQFVVWNEKRVLKPKLKENLFSREIEFYERIQKAGISDHSLNDGLKFFAKYYGVILVNFEDEQRSMKLLTAENESNATTVPYLVLENITFKISIPCIIDIKLGTQTYEPYASLEKINYECAKYPFQKDLGFRITGFKIFNFQSREYYTFDKNFCRQFVPEKDLMHGIALAFFNGMIFHTKILGKLLQKIEDLLRWMEEQQEYNFYSSSLLVVYSSDKDGHHGGGVEGDENGDAKETDGELTDEHVDCDVRMIDFGHVQYVSIPLVPKDPGCIHGLRTLSEYLQRVLLLILDDSSGIEQHVKELMCHGNKMTT